MVAEIIARREALAAIVVTCLAVLAGLGRKLWLDANDKECQRWFNFWPQSPLTQEQIASMERVVGQWSEQFHTLAEAMVSLEKANRLTEAGLLSHDVEYAEMNMSIALANAKGIAKRYAADPDTTVEELDRISHPG